jgi:hypothetical protein
MVLEEEPTPVLLNLLAILTNADGSCVSSGQNIYETARRKHGI